MLSDSFQCFKLIPFTNNEQSLASFIGYAKKGDLIIRDLGYFVLKVFKDMIIEEIQEGLTFDEAKQQYPKNNSTILTDFSASKIE